MIPLCAGPPFQHISTYFNIFRHISTYFNHMLAYPAYPLWTSCFFKTVWLWLKAGYPALSSSELPYFSHSWRTGVQTIQTHSTHGGHGRIGSAHPRIHAGFEASIRKVLHGCDKVTARPPRGENRAAKTWAPGTVGIWNRDWVDKPMLMQVYYVYKYIYIYVYV